MQRARLLAVVVGCASVAVVAAVLGIPDPAPASPAPPAAAAPAPATSRAITLRPIGGQPGARVAPRPPSTGSALCPEGRRESLRIERGGEVVGNMPLADALAGAGSIDVATGRHRGQRGLPIAAVVAGRDGIGAVDVVGCDGDTVHIDAAELRAEPQAHVIVRNSRGVSKVIDLRAGGARGSLVKNIAAIRLLPSS